MQPAASAGASLVTIWLSGQFHGVIRPQTPIGSWVISVSPRRHVELEAAQHLGRVGEIDDATMPVWISQESHFGAPISAVTADAQDPRAAP